jgi:hypothetical protein
VTGINKSAHERIGGLRTGAIQFVTFWETAVEHTILKSLPRANTVACYFRGAALLSETASCIGKQLNYDPTRSTAGDLTMAVEVQSDSFGLEWGVQLTPGLRTDGSATTGTFADDNGAGTAFGAQAYVQLVAFTGTSVTININHATTSGGSYTTLMGTSAMTAIGGQRLSVANNVTVNRFIEVTTVGTFSNAVFAVGFTRNTASGQVF